MAAYKALSSSFPRAEILGCLFHFGQCNCRTIQALSVLRWFTEDAEHALRIKCFQALAFVPPQDVTQRFQDFVATFSDEDVQSLRNTLTVSKQLGLEQCASGVVVNHCFLSGVGMSSTGSNMTFYERTTALKDGTMRSASVSQYPSRPFADSSRKLCRIKFPTK